MRSTGVLENAMETRMMQRVLREEWECKGRFATQAGTFLHLQIENYLNGKTDVCYEVQYAL